MAILEGIRIQNYRSLKDITLGKTFEQQGNEALPHLMAIIGANGVGKSTLLDALGFVGDCLSDGVASACDQPQRGGFSRLRTAEVDEPIRFEIRFRQSAKARPISYSLEIDLDERGRPHVVRECLRQARQGGPSGKVFRFLDLKHGEGYAWAGEEDDEGNEGKRRIPVHMSDTQVLGIATLGTLKDHPRIGRFRDFLTGWYLSYFMPGLARALPTAGAEAHLSRYGENLAKYLQFLEAENPQGLKAALDLLTHKIPGVQGIRSVRTLDDRLLLEFSAQGYAKPFYQHSMSDGTLKLLAYLLLLQDPDPAPLIGIEEPENGLHHQLLAVLVQELQELTRRRQGPQVLVTTHSPYLVDALAPTEVWIFHKNERGYTQAICAAEIPGVQEMFSEGLSAGSLWYSGHFGAANP